MRYSYECTNDKCKQQFTEDRPLKDYKSNTVCPKCKKEAKRVLDAHPVSVTWKV